MVDIITKLAGSGKNLGHTGDGHPADADAAHHAPIGSATASDPSTDATTTTSGHQVKGSWSDIGAEIKAALKGGRAKDQGVQAPAANESRSKLIDGASDTAAVGQQPGRLSTGDTNSGWVDKVEPVYQAYRNTEAHDATKHGSAASHIPVGEAPHTAGEAQKAYQAYRTSSSQDGTDSSGRHGATASGDGGHVVGGAGNVETGTADAEGAASAADNDPLSHRPIDVLGEAGPRSRGFGDRINVAIAEESQATVGRNESANAEPDRRGPL